MCMFAFIKYLLVLEGQEQARAAMQRIEMAEEMSSQAHCTSIEMMKAAGRGVEDVRGLMTNVGGMVAATGKEVKDREKEGFLAKKAEMESEGTVQEKKEVYMKLAGAREQLHAGSSHLVEQRKEDAREHARRREERMGRLEDVLRAMKTVNKVPAAVEQMVEQASAPADSCRVGEEVGEKRGRDGEMTQEGDATVASMDVRDRDE